jgi:hypothetical protein
MRAISANLQPRNQHPESAVLLHLSLQPLKAVTHKLCDLPAAQTRHVNVVALQLALVVVSLAVDVHQVEFIDQPLPLEQSQRSVHRAAIDAGIQFLRLPQNLAGIQMLARSFHYAQDGTPLLGHADPALREVCLQSARHFSLRKWHRNSSPSQLVATRMRQILTPALDGSGSVRALSECNLDATLLQLDGS